MRNFLTLFFVSVALVFFFACSAADDDTDANGDKSKNDKDSNAISDDDFDGSDGSKDDKKDSETADKEKSDDDGEHGGIIVVCEPGETRECYEGPSGSKGIGICKAGLSTCVEDGSDWSECVDQVLPQPEICDDGIDQNCDGEDMTAENAIDIDGDGYTYCDGDCCETSWDCNADPAMVNPGAVEILGNSVDDNCNGEIDEVVVCDEGLKLEVDDYPGNATKLAKGMGVCTGLISAEISLAGTPVEEFIDENQANCGCTETCNYQKKKRMSRPMPIFDKKHQTFAVEPVFGKKMTPLEGNMLSILSTGHWKKPTGDASCATLDTGDMKTASTIPEDWINMMPNCQIPKSPSCGGTAPQDGLTNQCAGKTIPYVMDPIMLTLNIQVPSNARAFEFDLFFMSIEFPTTVCNSSNYNDFFIALLDSDYNKKNPNAEYMNPYDKNLAKTANGTPVGVDLAPEGLFTACNPNCFGKDYAKQYCKDDFILEGTGFESQTMMGFCSGSGGTGWLKVLGNVVPGEKITLRLALWEQGSVDYGDDHSWDSTVVLDGFKWLPLPGKPGVEPK
ncbi:MAG: MopE-related protein [bacterium]